MPVVSANAQNCRRSTRYTRGVRPSAVDVWRGMAGPLLLTGGTSVFADPRPPLTPQSPRTSRRWAAWLCSAALTLTMLPSSPSAHADGPVYPVVDGMPAVSPFGSATDGFINLAAPVAGQPANPTPQSVTAQADPSRLQSATLLRSDLGASPIGSATLVSLGLERLPVALPLSTMPLSTVRWEDVLVGTPLASAPLIGTTWADVVQLSPRPAAVTTLTVGDVDWSGSALRDLPLAAFAFGGTTLSSVDIPPVAGEPATDPALTKWCTLFNSVQAGSCASPASLVGQTLIAASLRGAPVKDLPLKSIPLNQADLSASPLKSIPLKSIVAQSAALAAVPLKSIDLAASPLKSIPLKSIDLASSPLKSIPLKSIDWTAAPLKSIPLKSIDLTASAIGALPLKSIDWYAAPLKSIPLKSIDLASSPLKSIPLKSITLAGAPLKSIPLKSIDFSAAPLKSIPLKSIDLTSAGLAGFPLAALDWTRAALGTDKLSGFTTATGPLAGIPVAALADPVSVVSCGAACPTGQTLGAATTAGQLLPGATLAAVGSTGFASRAVTLGELLGASVSTAYAPTLGSLRLDLAAPSAPALTIGDLVNALDATQAPTLGDLDPTSVSAMLTLGDLALDRLASNVETVAGLVGTLLPSAPQVTLGDLRLDLASGVEGLLLEALLSHLLGGALDGLLLGDIGTYTTDTGHDITLGELGTWTLPGGDITLGDLARYLDSSVSLADVLLGLVPASAFPYENFPFSALGLGAPGRLIVTPQPWNGPFATVPAVLTPSVDTFAEWTFRNDNAVETTPVDLTVSLPVGTLFSSLTSDLKTYNPKVAVTVDGQPTVTLRGYTLAGGATERLRLFYTPGWKVTLQQTMYVAVTDPATGTTVDTIGLVPGQVRDGQEGRWVDARIPDLPLNPDGCSAADASCAGKANLYVDALASGHLSPRDRDWFRLRNVRKGTRITADLTNLPSDADLVLYGPAGITNSPSAFPADSSGLPGAMVEDPDLGVGQAAKSLARDGIAGLMLDEGWLDTDTNIWHAPLTPLSISQHRGLDNEAVGAVAPVDGDYIVQVSSYNGEESPDPYVLRVRGFTPQSAPNCSSRTFPHPMGARTTGNSVDSAVNAVFLTAPSRLAATYGQEAANSVGSRLDYLVDYLTDNPQLGVVPAIVRVDGDAAVSDAYDHWDASPCSVSAANAVTASITQVLKGLRDGGVTPAYITLVGGDDIIPMGRVPDLTRIANQAEYASTFRDTQNPLTAAEAGGYTLTDDPYGDASPTSLGNGSTLFVAQAAVGRLVEGPDEIVAAINGYVAKAGMLDSGTALVSGYDFLADGAQATSDRLAAPGRLMDSLIDLPGTTPGWTGSQLMDKLFPSTGNSPLVASLNAHYDHQALQSAAGDAAGGVDLVTQAAVATAASAGGADRLAGRIFFTMGCNAGLAVPDPYVADTAAANTASDWAQTLAKANVAVYIANTGYGIGDNHSVAYTERLVGLYAKLLDGQITAGQAFARAKQAYYGSLGSIGVYDAKVLQQSTFYGLPFWALNPLTTGPAPVARAAAATIEASGSAPLSALEPGPAAGLQARSVTLTPSFTDVSTPSGRYWTADGLEPQVSAAQPLQPRLTVPITEPGVLAHGALITALTSHDVTGVLPVVGAPSVDTTAAAPAVRADDAAWPASIATVATSAGDSGRAQNLVVSPGQFSGSTHDGSGVQRLYDSTTVTILYAGPDVTDFTPPTITSTRGTISGSTMTFTVSTADVGGAAVSQVRVGYELGSGQWGFVDLTQDPTEASRWTGSAGVHAVDAVVPFFVQSVDAAGNVALANAKHTGFVASADTTAPTVTASISPAPNAAGWVKGTRATVSFTCSDSGTGLDASGCPDPVTLSTAGSIVVTRSVRDRAGNNATAVVGVNLDGSAPTVAATVEPSGWSAAASATVTFACADDESGLATRCPEPVTVTAEGVTTVSRTVTDLAGNETTASAQVRLDRTAPTIAESISPEPNPSGWIRGTAATITFTCTDAVSGIPDGTCPAPLAVTEGVTTTRRSVADGAGNTAYLDVTVSVDGTAPVVTFAGSAPSLSCTTTDALSGVAVPATLSSAPGPSGSTVYTCSGAVDTAGNQAAPITQDSAAPIVFSGFANPIKAPPAINSAKKGSTVKLSFGLSRAGVPLTDLSAVSASAYRSVSCSPWAQPAGPWTPTVGKLTVAKRGGTYTYAWSTPRAGGCYEYRLTLSDGSERMALFKLT